MSLNIKKVYKSTIKQLEKHKFEIELAIAAITVVSAASFQETDNKDNQDNQDSVKGLEEMLKLVNSLIDKMNSLL